ncbi:glycerol-3-phosphate dehydrogenase [NAD+] [Zychaea mexicana]|uniref:glycerol-3-phosphate dehydrogenase [NAD+] n=1 Tax=Zychaea mexicana TaxID=64656 RepID=UPI0022FE47B2|nr:glycerol-3-phosphate dehydrogenase [NAD+] [Zychaea mexicana]KAI9496421.1 glycerol-3-phosphate dehydrogenase [NAD+] [Zychaea mexicana]
MGIQKQKVSVIGSGNWGSAIARLIGQNVKKHSDMFEETVRVWVFEEEVNGRKLTEIINHDHENVKYLPGIQLPDNVVALSDVREAARDANILVFVLPHQFVYRTCESLRGVADSNCRAISLIKGLDFRDDEILLFSDEISRILGVECSALSGANLASEVAEEKYGESTIGTKNLDIDGKILHKLFHTDYFNISVIGDYTGLQICGALKNVVAIAAGISDGLKYGNNTKSAFIRRGLLEMRKFGKTFFGGVHTETFFESCGVADLITTCAGGRNRKVAEAFIGSNKTIEEVEKELLNGQKSQGTTTALEVHRFLEAKKMTNEFPLLTSVYKVIYERAPAESIIDALQH